MELQRRIVGIVTNPASEWPIIAAEDDDIATIYRSYIALLAAIPAASVLVGLALVGGRFLGVSGIMTALTAAIASYAIGLASPVMAAVVIQKLAPSFKAHADTTQALKLVAYASTPVWLASVCYVFVVLSPLVVIGVLWGIYLFYLGMLVVLKAPRDQVIPFMLVSALTVIEAAELALIVEGIELAGARRRPRWQPPALST